MAKESTLKPVPDEELRSLPPEALAIFAQRCALRTFPLLGWDGHLANWGEAAELHARSIELAVYIKGRTHGISDTISIERVSEAVDYAAKAGKLTAYSNVGFAVFDASGATWAAFAKPDASFGFANRAARNARQATLLIDGGTTDVREIETAAQRSDLEALRETEDLERWQGEKLWLAGEPENLEKILQNFRIACASVGQEAIYERYLRRLKGDPVSSEEWQTLYDAWLPEWEAYQEAEKEQVPEKETGVSEESEANPTPSTRKKKVAPEDEPASLPDLSGVVTFNSDDFDGEDKLGRRNIVSALAAMLRYPDHGGRLTIGLLGDWGAGKTSVAELLEKYLKDDEHGTTQGRRFIVHTFSAWAYEHADNMYAGLAQEVVKGLTKDLNRFQRTLLSTRFALREKPWTFSLTVLSLLAVPLGALWLAVFGGAENLVERGGLTAFVTLFVYKGHELFQKLTAHPKATEFQTYLRLPKFGVEMGKAPVIMHQVKELCRLRLEKSEDRQLLFIVDDLDRCGPDAIIQTLEAIRLVMNLDKVNVLVAIDHRIALAALVSHFANFSEQHVRREASDVARDYLGKILQLPVKLTRPSPDDLDGYIDEKLFINLAEVQESLIEDHEPVAETTPGKPEETKQIPASPHQQSEPPPPDPSIEPRSVTAGDISKTITTEMTRDRVLSELATTRAMRDTDEEKRAFKTLIREYGLHNPRQLKRLHNCFRFLKGLANVEKDNFQLLEALFALEYRAQLTASKRKALDELISDNQTETAGEQSAFDIPKQRLERIKSALADDTLRATVDSVILPHT